MKKYLPAILAVVFVAAMAAFLLIPNLVAPSSAPAPLPAAAARPTETSRGTPIIYDEDLPSGVSWTYTPSSDCFSRIGYDADEETLGVTFRSSEATYYYYGVPASVWRELSSAASKGGYYNEHIKGQYACEKEG